MKKYLPYILLTICIICQSFLSFSGTPAVYPIFDPPGVNVPRNMRIIQQMGRGKIFLNLQGLNNLRASGSGQFSEETFKEMMRYLPISPSQLVVLDLRQESHGFVNGLPISWTDGKFNYGNLHKAKFEIEVDEYQRLRFAAQAKRILVNPVEAPTNMPVFHAKTERDVVEYFDSTYIRLPVTDHNRPSNEVIDQFVDMVKSMRGDQWLHFHCRAGKGRTTTFLTLLDIMKNARQVSLNDILMRQQFIGGSNLNDINNKMGEKKRAAEERIELVRKFYLYSQQVPDFKISWSKWIEQQQLDIVKQPTQNL
jgi:hypothetical protein